MKRPIESRFCKGCFPLRQLQLLFEPCTSSEWNVNVYNHPAIVIINCWLYIQEQHGTSRVPIVTIQIYISLLSRGYLAFYVQHLSILSVNYKKWAMHHTSIYIVHLLNYISTVCSILFIIANHIVHNVNSVNWTVCSNLEYMGFLCKFWDLYVIYVYSD